MNYLKHIKIGLLAATVSLAGTIFTSCEEDIEVGKPDNGRYETTDGNYLIVRSEAGTGQVGNVTVFDESKNAPLSIKLSKAVETSIETKLTLDEKVLTAYNEANGTNYKMYPTSLITLPASVTIAANTTAANANIVIKPGDQSIEKGELYAIPVTVSSSNESIKLSKGDENFLFLVKWVGTIPSIDKGDGSIKSICYVEVNDENILNVGEYYTTSGKPFFDVVNIFAANINYNSETGRVYVHCNDQVTHLLKNADKYIRPLQEKGIKVCMTILGNHDESGVANLSDLAAAEFAQELKRYVDVYGLDGIDFDDESSNYQSNPSPGFVIASPSASARLVYECRLALGPDKLITFYDWNNTPAGQTEGKM